MNNADSEISIEDFYLNLLNDIEHSNGNAPTGLFCLSARGLCMAFNCSGADLPWILVRTVVKAMLEATRQGFAAQYRAEWRHPGLGVVMHVALIVVDEELDRVLTEGRVDRSHLKLKRTEAFIPRRCPY